MAQRSFTIPEGQLIINSPYDEPGEHWRYDRESRLFERVEGRRPAGYITATPKAQSFDDPGVFRELPLVNRIRPRIRAWREAGYPGVTGITRRLLEHWTDPDQRPGRRLFFCQLEAIETLIWLCEASPADRQGIEVPGDGGAFTRICSKMATGSGKTIVMAMVIAWQVLNKITYAQDRRFAKHVLIVAPGLTVKSRLSVLIPDDVGGSYYDEFSIVPPAMQENLRRGMVRVINWHKLDWETEAKIAKKRSVDKRGVKSDEAYVRGVLREMASSRNILVINDEAHHAWRVPEGTKIGGVSKAERDEATKWIGGLDRIHRAREILRCYDFSATPFVPTGKKSAEDALFGWIVSDFGLNDAIESGLVKTPRVVIRDDTVPDAKSYKSKLYHLYMDPEVRDDLNRKAEEQVPLPDLVKNAYTLLGADWLKAREAWESMGHKVPPVMITVANRTETAARIKFALDHGRIPIEELCDPERTLHIDSKVLEKAEAQDDTPDLIEGTEDGEGGNEEDDERTLFNRKLTKKEQAERLRRVVDTVGQERQPGEQIQKVISVGMLSEGWDAKTVTHIMGLRAFSSQLLCEQVVGRGLRRTSYDVDPDSGMFKAEYVNIFGVPFTFLPHEGGDGPPPPPPPPKTKIEPIPEREADFGIMWPNILRIEHVYTPRLSIDMSKVEVLPLDAGRVRLRAELAETIDGKPDLTRLSQIDLEEIGRRIRLQRFIFEGAAAIFDRVQPQWSGNREVLLAQLVRIVEQVIRSDRIQIEPALFHQDELRRRIVLIHSISTIAEHIWGAITPQNTTRLEPVFDRERPIMGTGDMRPWYTGKPNAPTIHSHINCCVYDSTWEASEAYEIDRNDAVAAWVKNDHLGFEILYAFRGIAGKRYRPDFLIRLTNGVMLVLEVKGQDSDENRVKREALAEWVRAVNEHGGFGRWAADVSFDPADVSGILARHAGDSVAVAT